MAVQAQLYSDNYYQNNNNNMGFSNLPRDWVLMSSGSSLFDENKKFSYSFEYHHHQQQDQRLLDMDSSDYHNLALSRRNGILGYQNLSSELERQRLEMDCFLHFQDDFAHLKIPVEEIKKATGDFAERNLLRGGGFGKVYKGTLSMPGKPTHIVARRLHYDYGQGDLEFWKEITMLSDLKHENLVSFVGYCDEKGEKIIINKYEARGSLDKYLNDSSLTWTQRLEICAGIARALNYIHYDKERKYSVIHRNIKSSKILLDENWQPKLSGFELAMSNTSERRHRLLVAETVGTLGYVDPTYEKTGFVNHKSDVYSFGVVLFEVLCGRKAFVPNDQQASPPLDDVGKSEDN